MFVLAYTAVRVGELLRDQNDPRRRGVGWEVISLDDGSMDIYRKKQQWDAASLPDTVIAPLRSDRKLMDPLTERWPVFPTFDQRALATLVQDELAGRGERAIDERRDDYARDLLPAPDEDVLKRDLIASSRLVQRDVVFLDRVEVVRVGSPVRRDARS